MVEIIEGKPIHVGERKLSPIVRVETDVQRRAFVGNDRLAGQGWVSVHMRPIAILERDGARERRIPIPDRTAQLIGGLLLAALIIPLLLIAAARLARGK